MELGRESAFFFPSPEDVDSFSKFMLELAVLILYINLTYIQLKSNSNKN